VAVTNSDINHHFPDRESGKVGPAAQTAVNSDGTKVWRSMSMGAIVAPMRKTLGWVGGWGGGEFGAGSF
jgi:hypothetical protein